MLLERNAMRQFGVWSISSSSLEERAGLNGEDANALGVTCNHLSALAFLLLHDTRTFTTRHFTIEAKHQTVCPSTGNQRHHIGASSAKSMFATQPASARITRRLASTRTIFSAPYVIYTRTKNILYLPSM